MFGNHPTVTVNIEYSTNVWRYYL